MYRLFVFVKDIEHCSLAVVQDAVDAAGCVHRLVAAVTGHMMPTPCAV